jgi:ESS family glutamate:Na+ symporter
MELTDDSLHIASFLTVTLGIIALFTGKRLNEAISWLKAFSIPEPVTGGLLFSVLFGLLYALTGIPVEFELAARDLLLVYFFTTIGINASLKDLVTGGKPLIILLAITIAYMMLQNLTGISVAALFGLPSQVGLLGGTVSLIGGHGTAIAWAPQIAEQYGIANAMEIGIACATFGLILASLMGGPIARFLINRHGLAPDHAEPQSAASPSARRPRPWPTCPPSRSAMGPRTWPSSSCHWSAPSSSTWSTPFLFHTSSRASEC